jgi:hypothetical protein
VTLVDIEPVSPSATWTNNRPGEDFIDKRIDIFLVKESFIDQIQRFKSGVFSNGGSDHSTIILELDKPQGTTPTFQIQSTLAYSSRLYSAGLIFMGSPLSRTRRPHVSILKEPDLYHIKRMVLRTLWRCLHKTQIGREADILSP